MSTSPEGGGTGDLGGGLKQQSVGKTVRWRDPGGERHYFLLGLYNLYAYDIR